MYKVIYKYMDSTTMQQIQQAIQIKAKGMDYQRNGICGIGFYTMVFDWKDRSDESTGKDFIATFETDEDDNQVKIESCRVIDSSNPLSGFRGDNFGLAIEEYLHELRIEKTVDRIYDCMELIN